MAVGAGRVKTLRRFCDQARLADWDADRKIMGLG
jgi:hypothetical protein